MNGFNKWIGMGTVGADAQVRVIDGGDSVATMSIAINETYTVKGTGERKTKTEWVRIEAWRGLASFLERFGKKGETFLIEGKIRTDSWEQDGVTRYSTKIVADQINFAGGSKASGDESKESASQVTAPTTAPTTAQATAPTTAQATAPAHSGVMEESEDLPF